MELLWHRFCPGTAFSASPLYLGRAFAAAPLPQLRFYFRGCAGTCHRNLGIPHFNVIFLVFDLGRAGIYHSSAGIYRAALLPLQRICLGKHFAQQRWYPSRAVTPAELLAQQSFYFGSDIPGALMQHAVRGMCPHQSLYPGSLDALPPSQISSIAAAPAAAAPLPPPLPPLLLSRPLSSCLLSSWRDCRRSISGWSGQ